MLKFPKHEQQQFRIFCWFFMCFEISVFERMMTKLLKTILWFSVFNWRWDFLHNKSDEVVSNRKKGKFISCTWLLITIAYFQWILKDISIHLLSPETKITAQITGKVNRIQCLCTFRWKKLTSSIYKRYSKGYKIQQSKVKF